MSLRPRQHSEIPSPARQRRKTPQNSMSRKADCNSLPSYLEPGAAVEISSDEPGFRGSWYPGTVVTPSDKDSVKCQVEYSTLFFDKGGRKRLREVVDRVQLRPPAPPMSEREKERVIVVGEEVDAYYNEGWWEGVVTEVLPDGKFSVFFRSSREQLQFQKNDLRLHREWVNGAWKPPLEQTEEEEPEEDEVDSTEENEDISTLVDPETVRAIAKQIFSSGSLVEVSSDEEGFKGSWFTARVIKPLSEDKFLVKYQDLREENGIEPLKEEIDFLHIRPVPPSDEDIDFAVGDKVDVYYNDGWWLGVVTETTHDGRFGIFFKQTGERIRCGRQGLRLHKHWINGSWQLPLKGGKLKREKIVSCVRKVRQKKVTVKHEISIGTAIEISSEEEGFEDSWFPAKLIEYQENDRCLIEHDTLKAEDGKEPLRESVKVSLIRPQPPERVMVSLFEKFDKVNALYNDGWWVGVVTKVLTKSNYLVHFEKTQEVLKFHHSQLRLHEEWIDGKWITSSKSQKL